MFDTLAPIRSDLTEVATGSLAGAVSSVQVDTIATLTRNREDLYPDGEDALLTAAEALGAEDFASVARHWRSLADDALANEDAFATHERRYLHLSKTLWGTLRVDGEPDLDGGETVLAAFAALDSSGVDDLLRVLWQTYLPNRVIATTTKPSDQAAAVIPFLSGRTGAREATAFVCYDGTCQIPATLPSDFALQLEARF